MTHTINAVATDANSLFTALAADMSVDLNLPTLTFETNFPLPGSVGNPAYTEVAPINISALTSGSVNGTGVFDVMMRAMSAQLEDQAKKNRITGAEYAKVYLGGLNAVMQYGVQFLLGKDRAFWENLQLQAAVRLAQAQELRAQADIQIARATIQQMAFSVAETKLKAGVARNQYALTKMQLVTGYNDVLKREAEITLANEQIDSARASTKDTLRDGVTPIAGIAIKERLLKDAQQKLVLEQYESQRGQTRGTLSTGETVVGLIGTQTRLYEQQITSYKRDAESKYSKMVLDTWVARKTIDEGVAVPSEIDTVALNQVLAAYKLNLSL